MIKTILFIAILMILTLKCIKIQAQNPSPDKQILSMLYEFYRVYITEMSNGNPHIFKYKLDL
jgi:ABC-type antimicrobial peptide transport system permease subunit